MCCVSPKGEACACRRKPARTKGCEGFVCLWLLGVGRPADRSDRLGVLLAPAVSDDGEMTAWAFEQRPGAAGVERARDLIEEVSKRLPVIVAEEVRVAPGVHASVLTLREPPRPPTRALRRPGRGLHGRRRRR
ncbi:MAG: hypothetical protein SangKO_067660 [Sandaracinaceae bacterium]